MTTRPNTTGKLPLTDLAAMKRRGERIVMVTAYDYPSGRLADDAGVDMVLVGDSAAMTVLGHDSTVPATMEDMIFLARAAARGARRPLVVADMPFGSYQVSDEDAVRNAVRFVKEAGVSVDRPEAMTAEHHESGNILIAIRSNGDIWMDRRQVDLREVRPLVERLHVERPDDTVVVIGDKAAPAGVLAQVMDEVKLGGIEEVTVGALNAAGK